MHTSIGITALAAPDGISDYRTLQLRGKCGAPMNLVSEQTDANGFPLNPRWSYEIARGTVPAPFTLEECNPQPCLGWADFNGDGAPDWDLANTKGCYFGKPPCTTQPTQEMKPGPGAVLCNGTGPGHVLWLGMPVTIHSKTASWSGWSNTVDNDYNFGIDPHAPTENPKDSKMLDTYDVIGGHHSGVALEFNYAETVKDWNTDWWKRLRDAVYRDGRENWGCGERVEDDNGNETPCGMVKDIPGIATGMLGFDLVHKGDVELHPVYVLALRVETDSPEQPRREKWAIFFMNWGSSGYCGGGDAPLIPAGGGLWGRLAVSLPWPQDATDVSSGDETTFWKFGGDATGFRSFEKFPQKEVRLTVNLDQPSAKNVIFGELDLRWIYPAEGTSQRLVATVPAAAASVRDKGPPPDCDALISGSVWSGPVDKEILPGWVRDCLPESRRRLLKQFVGELPSEPARSFSVAQLPALQTVAVPPLPPEPATSGPGVRNAAWDAHRMRFGHALCALGPQWMENAGMCHFPGSASCGNGAVDLGEECDDHNIVRADGCSPGCLIETDFDRDRVLDPVDSCVNIGGAQNFIARGTKLKIGGTAEDASVSFQGAIQMPAGWTIEAFDPTLVDRNMYEPTASGTGARLRIADATTTKLDAVLAGAFAGDGTSGWSKRGSAWQFTGTPGTSNWPHSGVLRLELKLKSKGRLVVRLKWRNAVVPMMTPSALPLTVALVVGREGGSAVRGECGETMFWPAECVFDPAGQATCRKTCGDTRVGTGEVCDPPVQQAQCGAGEVCSADCTRCNPGLPDSLLVFVTKSRFTGAQIGGLAGADAKCAAEAQAANKAGTFKAWMSDSTTSAAARLTRDIVPYVLSNDVKVADGWHDLTDGSLDTAITLAADGTDQGLGGVWTATDPAGTISYPTNTCSNWTSTSGRGANGYHGAANGDWTRNSVTPLDWCSVASRLYCIQQ